MSIWKYGEGYPIGYNDGYRYGHEQGVYEGEVKAKEQIEHLREENSLLHNMIDDLTEDIQELKNKEVHNVDTVVSLSELVIAREYIKDAIEEKPFCTELQIILTVLNEKLGTQWEGD